MNAIRIVSGGQTGAKREALLRGTRAKRVPKGCVSRRDREGLELKIDDRQFGDRKWCAKIRQYEDKDVDGMIAVWNEVVEAGVAFPQEEPLTRESGDKFFAAQTFTGVAEDEDGRVVGLYILHPNNVGRCGHIANASYAVRSDCRGKHVGEKLVKDCLEQARKHGYRILQFNAVVEGNVHARHLYERLGFTQLGTIEGGFRMGDGSYANICPYYRSTVD